MLSTIHIKSMFYSSSFLGLGTSQGQQLRLGRSYCAPLVVRGIKGKAIPACRRMREVELYLHLFLTSAV